MATIAHCTGNPDFCLFLQPDEDPLKAIEWLKTYEVEDFYKLNWVTLKSLESFTILLFTVEQPPTALATLIYFSLLPRSATRTGRRARRTSRLSCSTSRQGKEGDRQRAEASYSWAPFWTTKVHFYSISPITRYRSQKCEQRTMLE